MPETTNILRHPHSVLPRRHRFCSEASAVGLFIARQPRPWQNRQLEGLFRISIMAEASLAALQSWLAFFFGTVLPIAFGQVGRWLYDWQGLATGILALFAAWIWGSRISRAVRSEEVLGDAGPHLRARTAPKRLATTKSNSGVVTTGRSFPTLSDELEALRRLIRSTLAGLPHTATPLTVDHQVRCERIAKFKFRQRILDRRGAQRLQYENLLAQLANLDVVRKDGNCRSIWEALTGINNAARSLLSEIRKSDQSSPTAED